ncbi:Zinc finger protein with KRAB and SCAN domains 5 [Cercospora beticola]|uniref:Zinc finger protein with KRAB and SCAN domains 5 n=2 Tax=Cercospora beticola TaxID=122368 RepID=A0A2G5HE55_CERBT|nr:Zinc finger protein with KRAB and SCAN domains 5 [Cercospora beticola]PIA90553.1 Zinc finger protein with KRAB and SCAN domains 5 [Cercospora beticola]CAK1368261.1 unnamed protein product [Cercospora beticola]
MSRSPKRNAIIMDEHNWPLADIPTPQIMLSASPSIKAVDRTETFTAHMDDMDRENLSLSGFHFSTGDAQVSAAEFHRIAARLLAGEEQNIDENDEEETPRVPSIPRHLHCDLGKDLSGRHCCSCGKSYSTAFRLTEHIRRCAGINNYPCHICDKIFSTQEALSRHITIKHHDDKEPCPECGIRFPSNYLPKHLATGLGGCDSTVQATFTPQLEEQTCHRQPTSQRYWVIDGDHSWTTHSAHDSGYVAADADDATGQTMSFVTRLLQRPMASPNTVHCDLCGDEFPSDGDALVEHLGQHSVDFSEKRHKCDDCRIYFANERDLNRHLQSANLTKHCGFTFRHNGPCNGHHPPTYSKLSITNDHALMQRHLWAWELSQFRTHRVAVATILAETLNGSADPHMSLADCKRTYESMLPHFAAANSDGTQSRWSSSQRDSAIDMDSLDAHFSRVIDDIDAQRALTAAQLEFNALHQNSDRPDSGIIMQASRVSFHRYNRRDSLAPASAEKPTNTTERPSSIRKSLLEKTLRKVASEENNARAAAATAAVKRAALGHKRYALSASGFALLRQRAELEERPNTAPGMGMKVAAATAC